MSDYKEKVSQLNDAYKLYRNGAGGQPEKLYELMYPYLRGVVGTLIKEKEYLDKDAVEDLVQDIVTDVFSKGIEAFRGNNAEFSTYCFAIAKNKANTFIKKKEYDKAVQP